MKYYEYNDGDVIFPIIIFPIEHEKEDIILSKITFIASGSREYDLNLSSTIKLERGKVLTLEEKSAPVFRDDD